MPAFDAVFQHLKAGGKARRSSGTKVISVRTELVAKDMSSGQEVDWDSAEQDVMAEDWIAVQENGQPV